MDAAVRQRPRLVPSSTYRLQVYRGFTLHAAREIAAYLGQLGIGAAYTSPYFAAQPGTTHGYDVSNHNEVNVEVGGIDALVAFTDTLREHDLQHIVDFVPNHMGIATSTNPWWRDVLENGPSARAGRFFDIDWFPVKRELRRKLLLPILGDQYGRVLERGELQLEFRDGRLLLRYFDMELPVNPRQAPRVYRTGLDELTAHLGASNPDLLELESVITALQKMPPYTDTSPDGIAERHRESVVAQNRLRELTSRSPQILQHIQNGVRTFNGTPGDPASFNLLHDLLEEQVYRLVVLADGIARNQLPPVLRHQQPGRPSCRGSRCVWRHSPAAREAARGTARHRRPDRPCGRTVRSGAVLRVAPGSGRRSLGHQQDTRRASPLRCRREDSVRRGTPAVGVGRARNHRLQLPESGQRTVRRPAATRDGWVASTRDTPD